MKFLIYLKMKKMNLKQGLVPTQNTDFDFSVAKSPEPRLPMNKK